jgi:isopentenyldiphosphate isomerase
MHASEEQALILVSDDGKPTGRFATRTECHRGLGLSHMAIVIFPFDEKGFLAIHLRSSHKLGGGRWDAPSTHVLLGESSAQAVIRCMKKEYGVDAKSITMLEGFRYTEVYESWAENEFCIPVRCRYDGEVVPNTNDIERVELVDLGMAIRGARLFPREYTPWMRLGLTVLERHLDTAELG